MMDAAIQKALNYQGFFVWFFFFKALALLSDKMTLMV